MKKAIYSFLVILCITSCKKTTDVPKTVNKDWLLGKWENNSNNGNLSEMWKKTNDSIYTGKSLFIKGKDTLHFEEIELIEKDGDLFYISTVCGQNNDQAIAYKLNTAIEKQFVFENLKVDYPQKIIYSPLSKEELTIEISGIQQGNPSTTLYSMKKTE